MDKRFRYPGAPPFSYEDRKLFFGRDDDINGFYKFVNIEELVVLYSQSGLGKSSLLNAGVVPKLKAESHFEPYIVKFSSYGEDNSPFPTRAIINEITGGKKKSSFLDKILAPDDSLWYHLKTRQIGAGGSDNYVLIFDQFENLFTFPDKNIRKFGQQLANLLNIVIPQNYRDALQEKLASDTGILEEKEIKLLYKPFHVHIVFAIRSDKMSLLNRLKDSLPNILNKTYMLSPLGRDQAEDAIIYPALTKGDFFSPPFDYSDDALDHMLNFLSKGGERKVESFQLQILCQYIEENIVIAKKKTLVEKDDLGDISAIFRNYYDNIISRLPEEEQYKARVFIEEGLIFEVEMRRLNVYEGQVYTKYELTKETLQELVNKRLLRSEPSSSGGFSYELSHDTLVAPILRAKAKRKREEKLEAARLEELKKKEVEKIETAKKRRRRRLIGAIIITYLLLVTIFAFYLFQNLRTIEVQNTALENQSIVQAELNESLQSSNADLEASEARLSESNQQLQENAAALQTKNDQLERTTSELKESEQQLSRTVDDLAEAESIANQNREIAEQRFNDLQTKLATEFIDKANKENEEKSYNTAKLYAVNAMLMMDYMDLIDQNDAYIHLDNEDHPITILKTEYSQKIQDIAFSPDRLTMALVPSNKNIVILWEASTGRELAVLTGHTDEINALSFSPDGQNLATSSNDSSIRIWNVKSGATINEIKQPGEIMESVRYSPDGKYIGAISSSSLGFTVLIWNTLDLQRTNYIEGGTSGSKILTFSNDGEMLAYTGADNSIVIYHLINEKKFYRKHVLKGHADVVTCLSFNRDNTMLASGSNDNNIVIWDLESGNRLGTLEGHGTNITSLQFSPESNLLASGDNKSVIKLWSIDAERLKHRKYKSETKVSSSIQSNVSKDLIVATLKNHTNRIASIQFLDNGRQLVSAGLGERSIKKWNIRQKINHLKFHHTDTASIKKLIDQAKQIYNLEMDGSEIVLRKSSIEDLYDEAELSYSDEDKIQKYMSILDIEPKEYDAVSLLASSYYNLGDYRKSIAYHSKYVEKFPTAYLNWNFLGNGYYGEAQFDSALICYNKVTDIKPGYFWAWYNKGLAYMGLNEPDEAIKYFNKAIEINPEEYGVWNYLGNAYFYKQEYTEAIEKYQTEIEYNPDNKWAWYNLGQSYSGLGDTTKAISYYNRALLTDPYFLDANQRLAELYLYQNDFLKSFGYYLEMIKIDESSAISWFLLGSVAGYAGGDYVYEFYEKSREAEREYDNVDLFWNSYGLAHFKNGDYRGAADKFQKALNLAPEDLVTLSNLAMSYSHLGEKKSAHWYFSLIIELSEDQELEASLLDVRGFSYLSLGQKDKARADLRNAQRLNSNDELVYRSLGCYYAENNQFDKSIENLEKAWQLGLNDYQWLENEPLLAEIKNDERFQSLIKKMKNEREQLRSGLEQKYLEFKSTRSADIYLLGENYALAAIYYQRALEISPENNIIRAGLAESLDMLGDELLYDNEFDSAYRTYIMLHNTSPEYLDAYDWNEVGNEFYDNSKYELATTPYLFSVASDSSYKYAWSNLGSNYSKTGDTVKAKEAFLTAIELDPNYVFPLNGIGVIYENQKNYVKAIEYFRAAISVDPYYQWAWNNLGNVYWIKGEKSKSVSSFKKVLSFEAENIYALDYLIIIYSGDKNYDSTVFYSLEKVKYYPDDANNWGNLSWYAVLDRQYETALEASKKGLELDPTQRWILVNQGHAYLMMGEVDQAKQIFNEIKNEPWNDRKLKESILEDFEALKELGISHPQMESIKQELER